MTALRCLKLSVLCIAFAALAHPAAAHPRHHHHRHHGRTYADGRPAAWCGWYMRRVLGVRDPRYNLARNWAHWGVNAGGPQVGAVVVWRRHVGRIVGRGSHGGWIINSGNDGHAVRTRERSLAGVIAIRVAGFSGGF